LKEREVREGGRKGGREGGKEGREGRRARREGGSERGGGEHTYLDHVRAVVVEVPELPVVLLMRPPEGVLGREGGREGGREESRKR